MDGVYTVGVIRTNKIFILLVWFDLIRLTNFNVLAMKFVSVPLGVARRPVLLKLIVDWEKNVL